ncbi:MAG: RNA polymerase factor sigma-54 [Wenzhouxiangellaceae bacterium]|nr:RNA polymerase factor sigma-54 [Wenzhouxiangellaceae bacterium]MBS3824514.1 RNA polymerase factor sigma-54 [Wenzhouxiangellaceae bacterium]
MAMATGLKLKLGHKLKLAPQLRQAIALLQLNRVELREHIEQALETNPLLELEPETPEADAPADTERTEETDRSAETIDFNRDDYRWNDLPEGFSEVADAPDYDRFISDPGDDSLYQHLLWQVNLAGFSDTDEAIARAIVYALDEDGFLYDDIKALRASLAPEYLVTTAEVAAVLERVQHFEPVGVAARSLQECLCIQLRALPTGTPGRGLAEHLIEHQLEALRSGDPTVIRKNSGFSQAEIDQAMAVIRRLDPRPGLRFSRDDQDYIVPDAWIHPDGEGWRVTLNRGQEPTLKINRAYSELIKSTAGKDRDYLREQLQQAQWLISSLELRNHTLRSVVHAIVQHQAGFLEYGDVAMQPLLQKEIAELVEVHESTVSRATTGKYIHTPRGTLELKHFFSVAIATRDGGEVSATAVRAQLEQLIRAEDPDHPLSDQALVEALADKGLLLARRTVAKYREQLGIGNSSRRRRMVP